MKIQSRFCVFTLQKNLFSIYNVVSLSEKAGEDKRLARQVMEYFPNPYFVINWNPKKIKLVKTAGRAQRRAYGMQTPVLGDKEEFSGRNSQSEGLEAACMGGCEGCSISEGQGEPRDAPFVSLNLCPSQWGWDSQCWNNWWWSHFYSRTEFWVRVPAFTIKKCPQDPPSVSLSAF